MASSSSSQRQAPRVPAVDDLSKNLLYAASGGDEIVLRLLLIRGADLEARNEDGASPLLLAAANGHTNCVKELLAAGANSNAQDSTGKTAIMRAADKNHIECLRVLTAAGADVNKRAHSGETALMLAAVKGHEVCLKELLNSGADARIESNNGLTALMVAAIGDHTDCLSLLIEAGAPIKTQDGSDLTALHQAALEGSDRCLKALIEAGADTDMTANSVTPLMLAADRGHENCVMQLLAAGADIQIEADNGFTALTIAEVSKHERCAMLLRNAALMDPQQRIVPPQVETSSTSVNETVSAPPAESSKTEGTAATGSQIKPSSKIRFSQLELDGEIGSSIYGKVLKGSFKGFSIAAKFLNLPGNGPASDEVFADCLKVAIGRDVNKLVSINNPNIAHFVGFSEDPPCLVRELYEQGSIYDALQKASTSPEDAADLSWKKRLRWAVGGARAMRHLHLKCKPRIVHGNLKSTNFLISSDGQVKLTDLRVRHIFEYAQRVSSVCSSSSVRQMTPQWLAPEVAQGQRLTDKSDVYAFGMVLWELLTWQCPWAHVPCSSLVLPALKRGEQVCIPTSVAELPGPPPASEKTFENYIALLKQCIDIDPKSRPNFGYILSNLESLAEEEGQAVAVEYNEPCNCQWRWPASPSIHSFPVLQ